MFALYKCMFRGLWTTVRAGADRCWYQVTVGIMRCILMAIYRHCNLGLHAYTLLSIIAWCNVTYVSHVYITCSHVRLIDWLYIHALLGRLQYLLCNATFTPDTYMYVAQIQVARLGFLYPAACIWCKRGLMCTHGMSWQWQWLCDCCSLSAWRNNV